jgi:asparagine synthase (glutamine-hydrolysing)
MQIPANVRNPRSNYNKVTKYWDAYAESVFAEHRDESIRDTIMSRPEKLLLRAAFQTRMPDLLPKSVLWRGKEAFSDGVSGTGKSWFEIIKDHLNDIVIPFRNYDSVDEHMVADTKEKMYYRSIFCDYYKACDRTIPYFWMPKFVDATDSSARTLKHYTAR